MPTFKMSMPDTSKLSLERKVEALENTLTELITRISWQQSKLDSTNVKRIDTNQTVVKSANGETVITGPILEMYDSADVLRLKQGYDSATDTFLFALYNEAGDQTVGIDGSGNATFTGAITGSTITGGTLQTAAINNARIVITGDSFGCYDSSNRKEGLYFDNTDLGIGDIYLYHANTALMVFYDDITGYALRGTSGATGFSLGGTDCPTYGYGTWDFSGATVVNTISEANHNHGGNTGDAGDGITMPVHNHSISSGGGHDGHLA